MKSLTTMSKDSNAPIFPSCKLQGAAYSRAMHQGINVEQKWSKIGEQEGNYGPTSSGATRNLSWRVLKFLGHHPLPLAPPLPFLRSPCVGRALPDRIKCGLSTLTHLQVGGPGVLPRKYF